MGEVVAGGAERILAVDCYVCYVKHINALRCVCCVHIMRTESVNWKYGNISILNEPKKNERLFCFSSSSFASSASGMMSLLSSATSYFQVSVEQKRKKTLYLVAAIFLICCYPVSVCIFLILFLKKKRKTRGSEKNQFSAKRENEHTKEEMGTVISHGRHQRIYTKKGGGEKSTASFTVYLHSRSAFFQKRKL